VDSPKGPRRRIIDRLKLDALMEGLEVMEDARVEPEAVPVATRPRTIRRQASDGGLSTREMLERDL